MEKFSNLDLTQKYSYADYLTWKFDERVELIKGWVLKMSPAPSRKHQVLELRLANMFYNYLVNTTCEVYIAPFDVRLYNSKNVNANNLVDTVVQPDICVVCDVEKLDDNGCKGAPDLIIEIVSKGNSKKELENKYTLYEENGVREYWVVQQTEETITAFDLVNNQFILREIYNKENEIPVNILNGFSIDLKVVFKS